MSVDGGVASCSGKVFPVAVCDVFTSFGVSESLGQSEINYIDIMLLLSDANQEIIRLDISV